MIDEFRQTPVGDEWALKWAIGNALDTVTTPKHLEVLLELALDRRHGIGRQRIVDRLARISAQPRVVDALLRLMEDDDVVFSAMTGLRRRLGPAAAADRIRPLSIRPSAYERLHGNS